MEEYPSGKGYRYGFLFMYLSGIALFSWAAMASHGLTFVLSLILFGFFSISLVMYFRYKVILGDDFIERMHFSRRKVFFKDILRVIIENQQAFVISSDTKLHISQDISNRTQLLQKLIERTKPYHRVRIEGDPLVISHLLNATGEVSKSKDNLGGSQSNLALVTARLAEKHWLIRRFEISTLNGVYEVAYYGRGMGYECVLVGNKVADKKDSGLWFAPEFQFQIGNLPAKINVRVWPWFTVRSFSLEIAGKQFYQEG